MTGRHLVLGGIAALLAGLPLLFFVALASGDGCARQHCPDPEAGGPPRRVPRPMPAGGARALGLGGNKSCAVMKDGRVLCWGNDERDPQSSVRTLFTDALNQGRYHGAGYGCELAKQRVSCWDGGRDMPAPAGQDFVQLWVGAHSGCAKHANGVVDCWAVGEPWANGGEAVAPTRYAGLHDLDDMIIGSSGVWLLRDGAVLQVRGSELDELKDSSAEERFSPSEVVKCGDVDCTRGTQGHVMCWSNAAHSLSEPRAFGSTGALTTANGQLCSENPPAPPVCVSCGALLEAPRRTFSPAPRCSIEPSGTVFCENSAVVEGNGLAIAAAPPRPLAGVTNALRVLEEEDQVCVQQPVSGWTCWQVVREGAPTRQLDGAWQVPTAPSPIAEGGGSMSVTVNRFAMCFADRAGKARCYPRSPSGSLLSPPSVTLLDVRRIAVGNSHACALGNDGGLRCWGANESGQSLAKAAPGVVLTPELVLSGVTDVAVGLRHTCAALRDHRVLCFGDSGLGQLGPGAANAAGFIEIAAIASPPQQLVAAFRDTCALTEAGTVFCWGAANGDNTDRSAHPVTGLQGTVLQLAAGGDRVCALVSEQGVRCWRGYQGLPQTIPGTAGSIELALGDAHGCVRLPDGDVRCWGANDLGQAGALVRATRSEITPPRSCPQITYDVESEVDAAAPVSW